MPVALEIWWQHFDFVALMLLALLLHLLIPLPASFHPLTLLAGLADNMQRKVHPSMQRPVSQQKLAGTLATLLLLLPLLVLLQVLLYLAQYPQLFEVVLLFLALDWRATRSSVLMLEHQLQKQFKLQAREKIGQLVLRDADRLSQIGLAKAGVEAVLQRGNARYLAVLFWFCCGGAVAAFGYRALVTLMERWNQHHPRFVHFSQRSATLLAYLDAIPARMLSLQFASGGTVAAWSRRLATVNGAFPHNNSGLLLECGSAALGIRLAGPAFYGGERIDRVRLNSAAREPQASDLRHALTLVQRAVTIWIAVLVLVSLALLPVLL